ncbi:MAG: hypothetical protein Kow00117_04160 [Phototrophicales bacterium]
MIKEFLRAGLLQFGVFGVHQAPFKLNLSLLASYPHILRQIAQETAPLIQGVDRLVCEASAVPMGVAVSLEVNIPLVYSLGTDQAGVYDLIGAYDVGHPTALILHVWEQKTHQKLIEKAKHVGLEVQQVISLFDLGNQPMGTTFSAIFNLLQVINDLEMQGNIPPGQAEAIRGWLKHR